MVKEPGEDGWDVGEYARAGVPGRRIRRKSPRPRSKPREWREDEGEGRRRGALWGKEGHTRTHTHTHREREREREVSVLADERGRDG